jgi:hypothetical protein
MIYIIWAPPRSGKTYYATHLIIEALRKDKRAVYSNYPVIDRISGKSSFRWSKELILENIHDAIIVVDEAYMDFSSRKYKEFSDAMHAFFAINGH